jgi:hypothetical protein
VSAHPLRLKTALGILSFVAPGFLFQLGVFACAVFFPFKRRSTNSVPSLLLGQRTTAVAADLHIFSAQGPGLRIWPHLLTTPFSHCSGYTPRPRPMGHFLSLARIATTHLSALDRAYAFAVSPFFLLHHFLTHLPNDRRGVFCGFILSFFMSCLFASHHGFYWVVSFDFNLHVHGAVHYGVITGPVFRHRSFTARRRAKILFFQTDWVACCTAHASLGQTPFSFVVALLLALSSLVIYPSYREWVTTREYISS